jgi:ABC-type antimicrobial peptide transport system permease subunit
MAACLAMLGIYGVTAYAVQRRTREVAIRIALGASERAVTGIFLRQGALLLGVGTAVGSIGAAVLSRVLRSHVLGLQSFDASIFVAACALVLATGFTAVFWAARRAVRAQPVSALNAG